MDVIFQKQAIRKMHMPRAITVKHQGILVEIPAALTTAPNRTIHRKQLLKNKLQTNSLTLIHSSKNQKQPKHDQVAVIFTFM